MNIDKNQIIDLLKSQGDHEKAGRAETGLPDTIDTDRQAGLLDQLGINMSDLAGKLPGGLGEKLGNLGL
jgi:hypothetical protein